MMVVPGIRGSAAAKGGRLPGGGVIPSSAITGGTNS